MQYHFLNILVVVLPFVGFVSAWVRPNGKCEAPPVGWGVIGNCSPADDRECIMSTTIPKTALCLLGPTSLRPAELVVAYLVQAVELKTLPIAGTILLSVDSVVGKVI
ncbi:hypothetical protein PTNB29_01867 [Pyrenophora teres f. teres]|nr:hypothetical protein PTNB29_01867 [Pyrenophora teres f. teres]